MVLSKMYGCALLDMESRKSKGEGGGVDVVKKKIIKKKKKSGRFNQQHKLEVTIGRRGLAAAFFESPEAFDRSNFQDGLRAYYDSMRIVLYGLARVWFAFEAFATTLCDWQRFSDLTMSSCAVIEKRHISLRDILTLLANRKLSLFSPPGTVLTSKVSVITDSMIRQGVM